MLKRIALLGTVLLLAGFLATTISQAGTSAGANAGAETSGKKKQKRADKKAKKMIRDGHYDGFRGDGATVNTTFCKNGRWAAGDPGFENTGNKWFVRNAKFTKKGFTAIIAENRKREQGGYIVAVGKRGTQWLWGIASFDRPTQMGEVERTDAKQDCKQL